MEAQSQTYNQLVAVTLHYMIILSDAECDKDIVAHELRTKLKAAKPRTKSRGLTTENML